MAPQRQTFLVRFINFYVTWHLSFMLYLKPHFWLSLSTPAPKPSSILSYSPGFCKRTFAGVLFFCLHGSHSNLCLWMPFLPSSKPFLRKLCLIFVDKFRRPLYLLFPEASHSYSFMFINYYLLMYVPVGWLLCLWVIHVSSCFTRAPRHFVAGGLQPGLFSDDDYEQDASSCPLGTEY